MVNISGCHKFGAGAGDVVAEDLADFDRGMNLDLVDGLHDVHDFVFGYSLVGFDGAAAELVADQFDSRADDTGRVGELVAAVRRTLLATIACDLQAFFIDLQVAAPRADDTNHFFLHAISSTESFSSWPDICLSKVMGRLTFSISPGAM